MTGIKKHGFGSSEAEILMGELIDLPVEIVKSTRRELIGVKGKIIDETMKTFKIEMKNSKEIIVQKNVCTFKFDGKIIDGKKLMFRPEDRIKKYWRKFHGKIKRMQR